MTRAAVYRDLADADADADGPACSRLQVLPPDELSDAQRAVYCAITAGRRSDGPRLFEMTGARGELLGPFAAMVAHPAVGDPLQQLGQALRYGSSLSAGAREVAILIVAAEFRSEYEWYAHAAVARYVGIPEHVVDELRGGKRPRELNTEEQSVWELTGMLLRRGRASESDYAAFRAVLGTSGIFEVVALVGYYSLLANLLEVFDIGLPAGAVLLFPDPKSGDRAPTGGGSSAAAD